MKIKHILYASMLCAAVPAQAQMIFPPEKKLQLTTAIIENYYVDTLNVDKVIEQGIIAMLKELDPHSLYTTAEETKNLTEPLNGNFSGIGVQYQMVQDTVYVIQAVPSGPSEKVGIIPGDRIVAANDTVIAGRKLSTSQVMKHLRGPKGSIVNLKVVRRSEPDTLLFRVKRDDIPLYTVDAAYMADPTTGYVRITSFGAETFKEFSNALAGLKKKGMKNLIIDLQDNGGGYLSAAVDLAEQFLPKGQGIVYTEGLNQPRNVYYAKQSSPDLNSRIVVLVNEFSASASEILSGALQDNDRGVIVGRRTFGKGLVQRPFPFPDGSMIRLTTARYYTPSGRSIQKPYEKGNNDAYSLDISNRYKHGEFYSADSIKLDENLRYTTLNGRAVYGGGGIMPDRFIPADTTAITRYYRELRAKNVVNQYVVDYVEQNRSRLQADYPDEEAFLARFEVSPEMESNFIALGQQLGVEPDQEEYDLSRDIIVGNIKGLIGRDIFNVTTYYRVMNPMSATYRDALQLINNPDEYRKLLRP